MIQKAAIVTGAGSGIGKATAEILSREGYFLYLLGRQEQKLKNLEKSLPGPATSLVCDLAEPSHIDRAVARFREAKDQSLEILINNAAIYQRNKPEEARTDIWRRSFQVNLLGTVELTEKLIPILEKSEGASIVNVASTLGLRAIRETSAYSASKAALINWTQSLALEMGPKIRVNCVCPGIVDTPIHPFHSLSPEEKAKTLETLNPLQPLQRIGRPDEIAEAVAFLAGPRSSWTTGAVLVVDGGINLVGS